MRAFRSNILFLSGSDQTVRISVTDARAKTRNLRRDPRASLHVTREDFFAYVVLEGEVALSAVARAADDPVVEELVDLGEPYFARPGEQGGVSVFLRDGDAVLHTWSGYGPVTELLCGTDILLDLTPLGRQYKEVELRHHDKYP